MSEAGTTATGTTTDPAVAVCSELIGSPFWACGITHAGTKQGQNRAFSRPSRARYRGSGGERFYSFFPRPIITIIRPIAIGQASTARGRRLEVIDAIGIWMLLTRIAHCE